MCPAASLEVSPSDETVMEIQSCSRASATNEPLETSVQWRFRLLILVSRYCIVLLV